jgi:hypothetical protein
MRESYDLRIAERVLTLDVEKRVRIAIDLSGGLDLVLNARADSSSGAQ